ncbi:MAG: GAF domain-containing protein, partial [Sulfuricella sp.]|nr:GAF domain-containing protein [Sulfuricella sp.]
MGNEENPLAKLQDLSTFLESEGTLDENLYKLATMAAKILNAENCSIMLLNDDEFDELRLRVCANFGDLPASAYQS